MTSTAGFAAAHRQTAPGSTPMSIGHCLHCSQSSRMLAQSVLVGLSLMTFGASICKQNFDIGDIVRRTMVASVALDASHVHLAVLALFPFGDNLGPALDVAIQTLSVCRRRTGPFGRGWRGLLGDRALRRLRVAGRERIVVFCCWLLTLSCRRLLCL